VGGRSTNKHKSKWNKYKTEDKGRMEMRNLKRSEINRTISCHVLAPSYIHIGEQKYTVLQFL
jgi:rhamnogalacturonyl hydrolase YesR